jgi:hypothetical protein
MTAIKPFMRASGRSNVDAEVAFTRRGRLLGVTAVGTDMRANSGRVDSRPVKTCGAAFGKSKALANFRIAGITHCGMSVAAGFFALRGVFFPASGVFGAVRADAEAAVALLLDV